MSLKAILFLCTLIASHLVAAKPISDVKSADVLLRGRIKRGLPIYKFPGGTSEGIQGSFYHEQAIDQEEEDRPQVFSQRYWVKDTHYREDGPVFLVIGGDVDAEVAAPSLLGEESTCDRLARKNGGMMVLLEHRYFGKSFPVDDLSEKNLEYLTISQVIGDLEQFALRGLNSGLESHRVPWVLIGSGYAGGIVHWALTRDPQVFWAGYSLSGMVHATLDFSQYWRDVAKAMPQECAKNIGRAILSVDETVETEDAVGQHQLRDMLGLQKIFHFDDVAFVLSSSIRTLNMPMNEASLTMFCEALSDGAHERDAIGGILREWGVYNKQKYGNDTNELWTTHDPNVPKYTDIRPSSKFSRARVLNWLKCMRFGWFQTAPLHSQRIVSLTLNLDREERICQNYFPGKYRRGIDPQVEKTNRQYGLPNKWPKRAVYLNEKNDPYHGVTVLAHLEDNLQARGRMAVADTDTTGVTVMISSEPYELEMEGDGYIKKWLDLWPA